jgi:hypothetical protein
MSSTKRENMAEEKKEGFAGTLRRLADYPASQLGGGR